ncbi:unnamed protein product, partial [Clonostachys rosea]
VPRAFWRRLRGLISPRTQSRFSSLAGESGGPRMCMLGHLIRSCRISGAPARNRLKRRRTFPT